MPIATPLGFFGIEVGLFRESLFFTETVDTLSVKIGIQLNPSATVFCCNGHDVAQE